MKTNKPLFHPGQIVATLYAIAVMAQVGVEPLTLFRFHPRFFLRLGHPTA